MSSTRKRQSTAFALSGAAENTLTETGSVAGTGRPLWQAEADSDDLNASPGDVTRVFASSQQAMTGKDHWQKVFVAHKSPGTNDSNTTHSKAVTVETEVTPTKKQRPISVRQAADRVTADKQAGLSSSITVGPKKEPAAAEKTGPTLEDMFQKGIEQGRRDAEKALAEAVRQQAFEQGFNEGREQAYQEGFDQGMLAAREEMDQQLSTLKTTASALTQHQALLNQQQIKDVALLLEHLVTEVVRVELSKNPEQIYTLVEEAVKLMDRGEHEPLRLSINPDDIQWLQPLVDSWSSFGQGQLTLRPDETITRGGCRIEGFSGEVDATIEERLTDCIEQLRNSLLEDPSAAPEIDISAIRETTGKNGQEHTRHSTTRSVNSFSRQETPGTRLSEPAMPTGQPGTTLEAGLGAWGSLGQ